MMGVYRLALVLTSSCLDWASGALSVPAAKTDRVAERALICCHIVLSRCPVQHPELVHKLIQRLAPAAGIPREAASEEVHCALLPCCFGSMQWDGCGSAK